MIGDPSNQQFYNEEPIQTKDSSLFTKTFFWMFLGLLGTAGVAAYSYYSGLLYGLITAGFFPILLVVELVVVLLFSFLFRKLSPTVVGILYFLYAFINGLSFSTIFYAYELSSIVYVFLISAAIYGGLAFYGYITKKDLGKWGNVLFGMLVGGLVITLINLFLQNSTLEIILDWVILIAFFGITVYDMNKIRQFEGDTELNQDKLSIYCAMQLYLDFINIFLRILAIFGKRRD